MPKRLLCIFSLVKYEVSWGWLGGGGKGDWCENSLYDNISYILVNLEMKDPYMQW